MATVGIMGPYNRNENLKPGQAFWLDLGESTGFANCALSITASARKGYPFGAGTGHVLKVDNVNITGVQTLIPGGGGLTMTTYRAGCNITNNGSTTVTEWSVLVGVIRP